jgi:hypothetical protein
MNLALPTSAAPSTTSAPRVLLRLEGALALLGSVVAFRMTGGHWLMFAVLFLAPDLAMLGYRFGTRIGTITYNAVHTYLSPAALAGIGLALHAPVLLPLAAVWAAHIAFDRALGFGLKYPTGFGDTHLSVKE